MRPISLSRLPIATPALFLGGLLWVAAFWLPVFETSERTITGYWVFVTGWMGFAMFEFAWYANVLMLMAVIMMYTAPVRATLLAATGLLVATQAFWFDVLPGVAESTEITGQGLGFWFWYASMFLLGLGVVFGSDEFARDESTGNFDDNSDDDQIDQSQTTKGQVINARENPKEVSAEVSEQKTISGAPEVIKPQELTEPKEVDTQQEVMVPKEVTKPREFIEPQEVIAPQKMPEPQEAITPKASGNPA